MSETSHLLRARWVFPVSSPPIEGGVIEVDGHIVRIGSGPEPEAVDLGDVAIIPGLVNAHTHLEFSHLDAPLSPPPPFADWVRAVVRARHDHAGSVTKNVANGVVESQAAGTTVLGEIATSPESIDCLDAADVSSTAFWEVLGLEDDAIARHEPAVAAHFAAAGRGTASRCIRGLSSHAPYSVHPELFQWTVDVADRHGAPVAMHLAETAEELELLESGTGPLVEMLREFGLWRDGLIPRGTPILRYLERLAGLPRVLVIHGNYLTEEEINYLAARPQFTVVYCPRTHAYFGHRDHPWRRLLERGVNVAIGTDSRASNPDLSVWNELLFLRRVAPDLPGEILLAMATRNGAIALRKDSHGTIEPGNGAHLAIVSLPDTESTNPYDRLLHADSHVIAAMHDGEWVHNSAKPEPK